MRLLGGTPYMYLVKISSNVDIVILSYIHIFYMFIKFYLIQIQIDVTLLSLFRYILYFSTMFVHHQ